MGIDFLIKGGFIIDGRGKDVVPKRADIAIEGDRITVIGRLSDIKAEKTLDIKGLYVCPGFIDVHSHSEFILLADGRAEGKISQGITTEINGNCGLSAAPLYGAALEQREKDFEELNIKERWNTLTEYFSLLNKKGIAVNFVTLVGHGNLRASVIGYSEKPLSERNKKRLTGLLRDALRSGARGLSTGLVYPPGIYSDTQEIIELAQETVKYGGIYTTHLRSEGDKLLEAVDEVIQIFNESKIHVHISHLKTSGEKNWKKIHKVLEQIEGVNKQKLNITCDRYPYIASSTDLDVILPSWAHEGGRKKELKRLKNLQKKLTADILKTHPDPSYWEKVRISSVNLDKNKWMEGKSLSEISTYVGKSPLKCLFDLLLEEDLNVKAIFFLMNEDNLKAILRRPYTMIGSDSGARSFDGITAKGVPHPRGFGSFPRVLGRYAREEGVISLSEAIYKMTGLPAKIFQIHRRGVLAEGFFADITIFDPERINDTADFNNPFRKPEGIYHVFINGTPVMMDGKLTGALPGRILK
jgi:N-acyl-D-amino-acid deacylase